MKKAIFHLLTIVVAFNGISGVTAVDCDVAASWQSAYRAETSIVSFILGTAVPSTIVSKFITETYPLCRQISNTPSKNEPSKKENKNTSDTILGIMSEDLAVRRLIPATVTPFAVQQDSRQNHSSYSFVGHAAAPPAAFIFFLLAYLVILSRVHLPWDKNIYIYLFLKPCPYKRTGFLHLRSLS